MHQNVDILNSTAHERIQTYTHTMDLSTNIWYRKCYLYCIGVGNYMDPLSSTVFGTFKCSN